jgi:hypothetical protein
MYADAINSSESLKFPLFPPTQLISPLHRTCPDADAWALLTVKPDACHVLLMSLFLQSPCGSYSNF